MSPPQDVESQKTEPTEQSATVLESKTESMIFSSDVRLFLSWLCCRMRWEKSVSCLLGLNTIFYFFSDSMKQLLHWHRAWWRADSSIARLMRFQGQRCNSLPHTQTRCETSVSGWKLNHSLHSSLFNTAMTWALVLLVLNRISIYVLCLKCIYKALFDYVKKKICELLFYILNI